MCRIQSVYASISHCPAVAVPAKQLPPIQSISEDSRTACTDDLPQASSTQGSALWQLLATRASAHAVVRVLHGGGADGRAGGETDTVRTQRRTYTLSYPSHRAHLVRRHRACIRGAQTGADREARRRRSVPGVRGRVRREELRLERGLDMRRESVEREVRQADQQPARRERETAGKSRWRREQEAQRHARPARRSARSPSRTTVSPQRPQTLR